MLKERKARFLPETMAEEERRIDGSREHGSSNRLCQVVERDELFRSDLIMNLETCVAGFHHHVVVRDLQFVYAFDVDVESAAAKGCDGAVQSVVARIGCEIV